MAETKLVVLESGLSLDSRFAGLGHPKIKSLFKSVHCLFQR